MLVDLLLLPLGRLDSKARFVLAAFFARYRLAGTGATTLQELSGQLRVPERELSDSLGSLIKDAVLLSEQVPSRGGGCPKKLYRLHDNLIQQLGIASAIRRTRAVHLALIERLLSESYIYAVWPGVRIGDSADNGQSSVKEVSLLMSTKLLTRSNRLLLAVLLAHADSFGLVRALSNADLSRLTGLDASSLKQRLKRLLELGFIRRHIPGVASPIFSRKLKSIYLLNLNHLQLSPALDVVCTAVHQGFDDSDIDCKFMTRVRVDRDAFLRRSEYLTRVSVLRLLQLAPDHVFDQLEYFICDCVSGFLSRHWVGVDPAAWKKMHGVDSAVKERVAAFFRVPMLDPKGKAVLDHDEVVGFFQGLIFDLANEFVRRFPQLSTVSFAEVSYILVPAHLSIGHQCIALLILRPAGSGLANHWTIIKGYGEPVVTCVSREVDIPLDLREQSGLLTRARAAE